MPAKVVESALFLSCIKKIKITQARLLETIALLAADPDAGDLIPGTRGLRKLRVALGNRGKSGGARFIYYVRCKDEVILLFAYPKNVQVTLTPEQLKRIRRFLEEHYYGR